MKQKSTITTKKIVLTALLAALTVAGSAIRVTLPIDIAGTTSFHLGNIMCALAGLLLGPWYGGLAAGLGSAIYDCLNPLYIAESWITFLTKGAYGLVAGLVFWYGDRVFLAIRQGWKNLVQAGYLKAAAASAAGAVTYAILYLAKSYIMGILVNGLTHDAAMLTLAAKLPATIFNGVVAIIFAPILIVAIKTALKKSHLEI
ncbi:MAG: ECF transporter S component [Faecousia sp.]